MAACSTVKAGGSASDSATATPNATPPNGLARTGTPSGVPSAPGTASDAPVAVDTGTSAQATIARLEREARAIARTTGCASAAACRSAPIGTKACGGPRTYVVYCAASTDTIRLFAKLRELERAEKAYNAASGMMSTCEMRLPPTPTLVGGSCREGP